MKQSLENRTKIVATLGPACAAQSVMQEMLRNGLDLARINFSHGSAEANLALLTTYRKAAKAEGMTAAVIQDLQGPKLRVGELPEGGVRLVEDSVKVLRSGMTHSEDGEEIPVPYEQLHADVTRGDRILLDDGLLELEVLGCEDRKVSARVIVGGTLLSYKGLTVPTNSLVIESLTEKDESDLAFGLKHGVDYVALSFVRAAEDVVHLREVIERLLPEDMVAPKIIVKIEKHEALQHFDAILKETDAVMVARGDLGLETSFSEVPVTQKELIAKCLVAGKPVITATDMLSSMMLRARPSRAEASDVANAVLDHTDAVMLSGETAMGRFPAKAVAVMTEIITKTEESPMHELRPDHATRDEEVSLALAAAAVDLAWHVGAEAILVTTRSGYSARALARFRMKVPVFAVTDDPMVQRQLQLSWGVRPLFLDGYEEPEVMMRSGLKEVQKLADFSVGAKVVVVSGLKREDEGYDSALRVMEV